MAIQIIIAVTNQTCPAQRRILSSQIGYDSSDLKRIIIRNDRSDYFSPRQNSHCLIQEGKR